MDQIIYFGYQEGFDPKLFPLGSLVLQYENPTQHRPYRHQQAEYNPFNCDVTKSVTE